MDKTLFQHQAVRESSFGYWFAIVALSLMLPISAVVVFNYFNDPHSVFSSSGPYGRRTNVNYVKFDYLINSPNKSYDYFLLGSSRVNALNITTLLSENSYTLSSRIGFPEVHRRHLEGLISHKIYSKVVIVGLGEAAYMGSFPKENPPALKLHPAASGEGLMFYTDYLFNRVSRGDQKHFLKRFKLSPEDMQSQQDHFNAIVKTGRDYCVNCAKRALALSDQEHRKNMDGRRPMKVVPQPHALQESLGHVQKIHDIAKANDIKLVIYFDPLYRKKYLALDIDELQRFKRGLAEIQPFIDFSSLHADFAKPRSFADHSHYTEAIGDILVEDIKRVLDGREDALQYGFVVNKNNVSRYLDKEKQLFNQY